VSGAELKTAARSCTKPLSTIYHTQVCITQLEVYGCWCLEASPFAPADAAAPGACWRTAEYVAGSIRAATATRWRSVRDISLVAIWSGDLPGPHTTSGVWWGSVVEEASDSRLNSEGVP
jgi:hypothetical protein